MGDFPVSPDPQFPNGVSPAGQQVGDTDDRGEAERTIKLELELKFFGNYTQAQRHVLSVAQQLRLFAGSAIHIVGYQINKSTSGSAMPCHHKTIGVDSRGKEVCVQCGREVFGGVV